jgi:hypothetical protein
MGPSPRPRRILPAGRGKLLTASHLPYYGCPAWPWSFPRGPRATFVYPSRAASVPSVGSFRQPLGNWRRLGRSVTPPLIAVLRLEIREEATTGFEPVIAVLQTAALPLGYVAGMADFSLLRGSLFRDEMSAAAARSRRAKRQARGSSRVLGWGS